MKTNAAWLVLCLVVAACDGPRENAGERIDAKNGATGGSSSIIAGPAEKAGEQADREAQANHEEAQANDEEAQTNDEAADDED